MNFENQTFLVAGIANKKSVAYFIAKALEERGADLILTGQSTEHITKIIKLFPKAKTFILDVSKRDDLASLAKNCGDIKINGIVHSLAYAHFSTLNFLETPREDFLQACQISAFSFVEMANALKGNLTHNASLITISISNTKATSYGYLGPIKAMLNSLIGYMAKAFSETTDIRVNAIGAGPLKTSASAGIPGYLENYLFAEALTLRKKALSTSEVAKTALFLLSDYSSGINGEVITLDAGMNLNHFDQDVVNTFTKAKY